MHIYSSLFALNYHKVQKTLWAMKKCGMGGGGSASYTRGVLINFLWNFSHILNDALLFLLDNEIRHGFEIQFLLWEKTGQQLLLNNVARNFIKSIYFKKATKMDKSTSNFRQISVAFSEYINFTSTISRNIFQVPTRWRLKI